ncbi:MAG: nitroreductase family deazaflavin-dependent oxidoreductase [Acidimicrobiia bacterium]
MTDWNTAIIDEFRANEGVVGGVFSGAPLLILHSKGAKSGADRLAPLMYLRADDRIYVFASKAGSESHPDWFYNVKAHPEVSIEIGTDNLSGTAIEIVGDERDSVFALQAAAYPKFAEYQNRTDRIIPVFEIATSA